MVTGFELVPPVEVEMDESLPTAPRLLWRRAAAGLRAALAWYGRLVLKYLGGRCCRVVP